MLKKFNKNQSGFTIIEVLIVLAIAGLIMLVVFLAVPTLQRNSRNNNRNNEASRVSAAVTECLANRNGQTGSCNTEAALGFEQLAGPPQSITGFGQITDITFTDDNAGGIAVANVDFGSSCNPAGNGLAATPLGGARAFTVRFALEGGGSATIARCIGS